MYNGWSMEQEQFVNISVEEEKRIEDSASTFHL